MERTTSQVNRQVDIEGVLRRPHSRMKCTKNPSSNSLKTVHRRPHFRTKCTNLSYSFIENCSLEVSGKVFKSGVHPTWPRLTSNNSIVQRRAQLHRPRTLPPAANAGKRSASGACPVWVRSSRHDRLEHAAHRDAEEETAAFSALPWQCPFLCEGLGLGGLPARSFEAKGRGCVSQQYERSYSARFDSECVTTNSFASSSTVSEKESSGQGVIFTLRTAAASQRYM
jgi:hypothetical protein